MNAIGIALYYAALAARWTQLAHGLRGLPTRDLMHADFAEARAEKRDLEEKLFG